MTSVCLMSLIAEQIIRALEAVERFDVIEDSLDSIIEDCEDFERRKAQWGIPSVIHSTNFDAFVIHSPNDTGNTLVFISS